MPAAGTLIVSRITINMTRPALGTAAVPIEASNAKNTMLSCAVRSSGIPRVWAMNTAATAW